MNSKNPDGEPDKLQQKYETIIENNGEISDRDRRILRQYLHPDERKTMEEIGTDEGITRQRVDQILKRYDIDGIRNSSKFDRVEFNEEEVLDKLREFFQENGRPPMCSEWDPPPSSGQIVNMFDGWEYALLEAGLPLTRRMRHNHYTKDELIQELKDATDKLGKVPSFHEMNNMDDTPRAETYRRRFGSWSKALSMAGFEERAEAEREYDPDYTDDELLNYLTDYMEDHGRRPYIRDWKELNDVPDHRTIRNHFGSWMRACWLAKKRLEKNSNKQR